MNETCYVETACRFTRIKDDKRELCENGGSKFSQHILYSLLTRIAP